MRLTVFLGTLVVAAALAAATAPVGGATGECRGIMACIRVPGSLGRRASHRHRRLSPHLPGRTQHRRRPRCAGHIARRAREFRRSAGRTRATRRDDDALRALPCGLDGAASSGVPTTHRVHPDAGRRGTLDGVRARDTHRACPRASVSHRRDRSRRGALREGLARATRSSSVRGRPSPSARSSRQSSLMPRGSGRVGSSSGRRSSSPPPRATGCRSTCMRSSRSARSAHHELRVSVLPDRPRDRPGRGAPCGRFDRRRSRYAVAFTNLELLAAVAPARRPLWRWLPLALFLVALASASAAVARPRASISKPADQATVVLLVDVSGSMRAADVKPSRLGAAQSAMQKFVARVPKQVKVGLVSFSSGANEL